MNGHPDTTHSVNGVRRLVGELQMPGEVDAANRHVLLAALSAGESRVHNVPVGVDPLLHALQELGVAVRRMERTVHLQGGGPDALRPPERPIEACALGTIRQSLLGVLAARPFSTSLYWGPVQPEERLLCERLLAMGARIEIRDEEGTVTVDGESGLHGCRHDAAALSRESRLGLALAGVAAQGPTVLLEPAGERSRIEGMLREHRVPVEGRREESTDLFRLTVNGPRSLSPVEVTLAGDLALAYPFMIIALSRRGSRLTFPRLEVSPARRGLLDVLRQVSDAIDLDDAPGGVLDITVTPGKRLRATHLAGRRAERVGAQVGLVAVLATQCSGEFVIRPASVPPAGSREHLEALYAMLKRMGARVGAFEGGLVIQGGFPLEGATLDCRGDADLALAGATAGALAHGTTVLHGTEGLEQRHPDFFAALDSVTE